MCAKIIYEQNVTEAFFSIYILLFKVDCLSVECLGPFKQ